MSEMCQLATNAVQQIASYSITSRRRREFSRIVCPHPGDPMPAFLSGPDRPDAYASHHLKLFFMPRPRRRVCALLSG
jgi:hypothetical protein